MLCTFCVVILHQERGEVIVPVIPYFDHLDEGSFDLKYFSRSFLNRETVKFNAMVSNFNIQLLASCQQKNNRLCLGLDIDPAKLPGQIGCDLDSMRSFSRDVVDATIDITPVYKLNLAFYERLGSPGIDWLNELVQHIGDRAVTIADGKRGDIGNTSRQYAQALFNTMGFDAATISPYMGRDAVEPFLDHPDKGVFILCLTSNTGAQDFQYLRADGQFLYQHVAQMAADLNIHQNVGLVVGATQPQAMQDIRQRNTDLSWLVPGVGAQGGDLESAITIGNQNSVAIINVSRGILYAGQGTIPDIAAAANDYTCQIRKFLTDNN